MKSTFVALFAAATIAPAWQASAAIMYAAPGSIYSQDFNTLPNLPNGAVGSANASIGITGTAVYGWRNDFVGSTAGNFSIEGWHLLHPTNAPGTPGVNQEGGFNGNQRLRFGTGSSSTGAFYSFGSGGNDSDRALGVVNSTNLSGTSSTSMPVMFGAAIRNDTGATLTEFTLSYFGEQWRNSGAAAQSLVFDYSLNAANIQDTSATRVLVSALDFASPVTGGSAAAVAGNTTGRVAVSPITVAGLDWADGQTLWIRWTHKLESGVAAHGLAIDDLSFSAQGIPEPATSLLVAIGLLAATATRRRA